MVKSSQSFLLQKILVLGVLCSAWAGATIGAQNPAPKPNPRQILARGVQELGGKENLAAIFARQIVGTFTRKSDGAAGTIEIFTRQPNYYFLRLSYDNTTEQISFDGITGYSWKTGERPTIFHEKEFATLVATATHWNDQWYQNELQRINKLQKTGLFLLTGGISAFVKFDTVDYKGENIWQGKKMHSIHTYLNQGAEVTLDFGATTGLLHKEQFTDNQEPLVYEYDDYRKNGATLAPYFVKITNAANDVYEIKVQRIILNQAIPDEIFELPKAAQIAAPELQTVLATAINMQEKSLKNYDRFNYLLGWKQSGVSNDGETGESYNWERNQMFDVSFHRGFAVKIPNSRPLGLVAAFVILKTGDPTLPDAEKAKLRQKMLQQIDDRYKKSQANGKPLSPVAGLAEYNDIWNTDILTILQNSRFTNYRKEIIQQNHLLVVDFFHPSLGNNNSAANKNARGTIWLDEKSFAVVKVSTHKAEIFKKNTAQIAYSFEKNTEFEQEQQCENLWLPKSRTDWATGITLKFIDYRLADLTPVCDANKQSTLK